MSDWIKCKVCGEYGWRDRHRCPPVWVCRMEGEDEDGVETYAHDAERAAEKFAKAYDEDGEYSILRCGGEGYIVVVRAPDDTTEEEARRFTIAAESVPTYYARMKP